MRNVNTFTKIAMTKVGGRGADSLNYFTEILKE